MSLAPLPQHDALHVVSDLHMGGMPGFQILRATERLADRITRLARHEPDRERALVLNGDVFDTLAEESVAGPVDLVHPEQTVAGIMEREAFRRIWDALATFVGTPRRTLVFVIGNHDIEIALPPVQRLIRQRLTQGDPAALGRLVFSTAGAGYACTVGDARVYCIHGNEVDAWNYNRYEDLARAARHLNAGRALELDQWRPNAGTRMVKEVMNTVKRRYAWIDLLKPENQALVGILVTLDHSQLARVADLPATLAELTRSAATQQVDRRLGAQVAGLTGSAGDAVAGPAAVEAMLGTSLRQAVPQRRTAQEMLLAAESSLDGGVDPAMADARLGSGQFVWDRLTGWLRGIGPDEGLRRALQDWLRGDTTFDLKTEDQTYRDVMASVGPDVDIVVTGHTHLAKAIVPGSRRLYFNSGTWIRLMQLKPDWLVTREAFKPVYDALAQGSMSVLDATMLGQEPLVLDRTTEVEVSVRDNRVTGWLHDIRNGGLPADKPLAALDWH